MSLFAEGLLAMRGCWRLIRRDPEAFQDFNLTTEGFWRSFAMIIPVAILAYPLFISGHQFEVELAAQQRRSPAELQLGRDYAFLLGSIVIWPVVAAFLARLFGVARNYVRYIILYNWMTVPLLALTTIPQLFYVASGAALLPSILVHAAFIFSLYVSWYVARAGLRTTILIAFVFLAADLVVFLGLNALMR